MRSTVIYTPFEFFEFRFSAISRAIFVAFLKRRKEPVEDRLWTIFGVKEYVQNPIMAYVIYAFIRNK